MLIYLFTTDPATIGWDLTAQAAEEGCDFIWGCCTVFFIYLESASCGIGRNHRPLTPVGARKSSLGGRRRECRYRYWQLLAYSVVEGLSERHQPVSAVNNDKFGPERHRIRYLCVNTIGEEGRSAFGDLDRPREVMYSTGIKVTLCNVFVG